MQANFLGARRVFQRVPRRRRRAIGLISSFRRQNDIGLESLIRRKCSNEIRYETMARDCPAEIFKCGLRMIRRGHLSRGDPRLD